jgi:hypothetical protein
MKLKDTLQAGARKIVGAAMRVYRASPLYPRCGHMLAKLLGIVTRSATKTVIRQIDGVTFELDMREIIDASLFYSGTFEAEAEKTITAALRPGMIALDIGANFGYHTFRMARAVGNDGKVIAIEPTGWAFGKLQRNISLNSFNNIRPLQVALGDFDHGAREFRFQSSYRLDGTDLSADGFEGKVIRGAQETLARYHPILFFEITPSAMRANGDDPVELVRTLTGLGYIFQTEARKPIREIGQYLAKVARGFCVNLLAVPLVSERYGGKHQSSRNRVPS